MLTTQNNPWVKDFPILAADENGNRLVYLDSAATTQHPQQVLDAVLHYYQKDNANPHRGVYELAMRATDAHEGARHRVARFFGAEDDEIVFTQNTTESLNLVAYSYGLHFLHEGDEIVISVAEHHSNLVPWQRVAKATGAKLVYLYPGADGHLTAEELDKKIKRTPTDHPGYNEYQYHLDPIEHDPWQLTSFLTTLYDDYTRSEVQGKLKETFKKQYKLTTWVEVQIRYKTVWVISPAGIPVPTQVPYEYRIFHTKLVNRGLEVVIREELDADQWKRYEIFQDTLGGRPYLFNGGLPPGGSDGSGAPGIDYQVPAEALTDSEFAAIYKEAQKYVGTPYVWGGSTPETGFDCSGYVCWVYNQNGYDVGRTTANGLWNKSQHISEAEAKPGDLVFFKGTYDTPGMSHTGIYLGNGMMVSAGDPIKYANIHSSYWEKHLAGFGRLSK